MLKCSLKSLFKWKDKYKNFSPELCSSMVEIHSFKGWFKREIIKAYFSKQSCTKIRLFGKYFTTPNLFSCTLKNPLRTWWKARKYFKMPIPKIRIHRVNSFNSYPFICYHYISKILHIFSRDIRWKDKYNSPRHEQSPLIYICLFKKLAISISFSIYYRDEFGGRQIGDMQYWEYLLWYLYYNKRNTLKCYSTWTTSSKLYKYHKNDTDESEDIYCPYQIIIPCVAMSLNKRGIKRLKEELENGTSI